MVVRFLMLAPTDCWAKKFASRSLTYCMLCWSTRSRDHARAISPGSGQIDAYARRWCACPTLGPASARVPRALVRPLPAEAAALGWMGATGPSRSL